MRQSDHRGSNNGAVPNSFDSDSYALDVEMSIFDRLPPAIRAKLANSTLNYSAKRIREKLNEGFPEYMIWIALLEADAKVQREILQIYEGRTI